MAKRDCLSEAAAMPAAAGQTQPLGHVLSGVDTSSEPTATDRIDSLDRLTAQWLAWSGMAPARRRDKVRQWAAATDTGTRRLLAAAAWDEKPAVALAAIEGLRSGRDPAGAASLESLASISRSAPVRAAALETARMIRGQAAPDALVPADQGADYWASFIDGDGAQLLLSVRPGGKGDHRLTVVAVSDRRGLGEAWGVESVSAAEVEEIRSSGGRGAETARGKTARGADSGPEIGWVRVDGLYCAATLASALEINRRDHRRLSGCWELYKDAFPAPGAASCADADLDAMAEAVGRRQISRTASLVHFEGFRSWLILGEDVAPFLPAARQALSGEAAAREGLLGEIVSACLAAGIRAPQRRLWRSRLLRQEALWQRRGDRVIPDLCRAAAWGLGERTGVPSYEHPLLRAMVRSSLEIALGG
jgi:hypothetical protein